MLLILLLTLQFQQIPAPAELAAMASELYSDGRYTEALEIWQELLSRMPHRGRIAYNLAASQFMMDSFSAADSTLSFVSGDVGEDTLSTALILTNLAMSIQNEDYGGVERAVNGLRSNISDGVSAECERSGLEAGLNWLDNHEPPEDQQDQSDDQQDDSEDQQDDSEDQQDQSDDQQDQSDDQQDDSEDQQDDSEDQQDQSDDQQDQSEEQPQPPPRIDEMTPEQAQAILDLVEENQMPEDSTGKTKTGIPSGPVW